MNIIKDGTERKAELEEYNKLIEKVCESGYNPEMLFPFISAYFDENIIKDTRKNSFPLYKNSVVNIFLSLNAGGAGKWGCRL